jgi:hypothetical protein
MLQVNPIPNSVYQSLTLAIHSFIYWYKALPVRKQYLYCGVFLGFSTLGMIVVSAPPSDAAFINPRDLSSAGKVVSQAIGNSAEEVMKRFYTQPSALRTIMCQVARFFCLIIFGFGLIRWMNEGNDAADYRKDPIAIGTLIFAILFSAGGYLYGQLYYGIYQIFDAILDRADGYARYYDLAAGGKALITSIIQVGSVFETCKGMVGQDQAQCLADNAPHAASYLTELRNANPSNPFLDFLTVAGDRIGRAVKGIVEGAVTLDVGKIFWSFVSPAVENVLSFLFSVSIVMWDVLFYLTFMTLGLAIPVIGISSLVTQQFKSGLVVVGVSLSTIFLWRLLLWAGYGEISRIILNVNDPFSGPGPLLWGMIMGAAWPILSGAILSACAKGVFSGLANSAASTAQMAGQLAMMAATRGVSSGASSMGASGGAASAGAASRSTPQLPQSNAASSVRTDY